MGGFRTFLLIGSIALAAFPAFGRQQDFTSQAAERLRLALENRSREAMERLSEPGSDAVPDDFFDRYENFDVSGATEWSLQQFASVRGGGRYLTGVFAKTEVEPEAYRWVLVDAFWGSTRRLNAGAITAALDRGRRATARYDGFKPLAHDARFLDFSMAVNARNARLLAFLKDHGVTDLGRVRIAPLDHHSFFVIDDVRALRRAEGSPVRLRFVWAYLPSGEGRVTSGWFLRDVRERPETLASVSPPPRASSTEARDETGAQAATADAEALCCAEAERLRALQAVERAEREKVKVAQERLLTETAQLRAERDRAEAERDRAEAERRAVAARLDSLKAKNRRLPAEREPASSEKSDLVAAAYSFVPGGGQFYKGNFRRGVTYASIITTSFVLAALTQRGVDGADKLFKLRRAKVQQINGIIRTCEGCTARDRERLIAERDRLIIKRDKARETRSDRRFWRNLSLFAGVTTVAVSILDSIELDRKIGERFFRRKDLVSGGAYRISLPRPVFSLDGSTSVRLTVQWK